MKARTLFLSRSGFRFNLSLRLEVAGDFWIAARWLNGRREQPRPSRYEGPALDRRSDPTCL